jgi:competence protein ComEC
MRVTTDRSAGEAAGIGDPDLGDGPPGAVNPTTPWARALTSITHPGRIPSWAELCSGVAREVAGQFDRLPLWTPVAFGIGAAIYLGLKSEPQLLATVGWCGGVVAAALIVAYFARWRAVIAMATMVAVGAAGLLVSKLHSDRVAAPIAPGSLGAARVEGWVVDVETPSDTGERLLIAPVRVAGLAPEQTPTRVRIVVRSPDGPDALPAPGSAIRVLALLDPPPGPASPGAYDFARDAWFEGIGGVGLALRWPSPAQLAPPPWGLRVEMAVNAMRWSTARQLAANIRSVMGADDGGAAGLAVAVTTSHQDWLVSGHRDDLRASGLAHMLAIAGLHTAAVSGFAFFACRLAIAAWPWLALRVPGKKVAAVVALIAVAAYLLLSGAHPPARRAAITASVAFFAILVDRRAVSLHSLAMAALIILAIEPDVVVSPGFEMSFCATASLIALSELWRRPTAHVGLSWPFALLQRSRDWLVGMSAVSLVAGMATGPFAIQHFNRVANYGVVANLSADLLASVVLMPALGLSLVCQGSGLDHAVAAPIYWVAGWSARGVITLGHLFATAPWAVMTASSAPQAALAISYLGIVFACLWRGRLRWIGLPMAAAVMIWPRPTAPVAWIAADGDDAAIVIGDLEVPLKPGARQYATGLWAQRRGFTLSPTLEAATAEQIRAFDCDRRGCASNGLNRPAISAWWSHRGPTAAQFDALCAHADILILRAEVSPPPSCASSILLDAGDFRRGGAAEVFGAPGHWRIAWAQPLRGDRPWTLSDNAG